MVFRLPRPAFKTIVKTTVNAGVVIVAADCSLDIGELSKATDSSGTSVQLSLESVAAVVREKMEVRRAVR